MGPFITHGIDIWSPDDNQHSVFIFAVNHLPNPAYSTPNSESVPNARSRIEVFDHVVGTPEAKHLRSIWHPLLRTPNDIYARSADSFYVTNDHYYREGYMRVVEDIGCQHIAGWTDLIHIHVTNLTAQTDMANVVATVAIEGLHTNNGLGRGKNDHEILVGDSSGGVLIFAKPNPHPYLEVVERVQLPSTIDNPSFFSDPFAKESGRDASGYVVAGLARAIEFPTDSDPVMVWLIQPYQATDGERHKGHQRQGWTKRLIFQDDGKTIGSAATAVLVAIDPQQNSGRKQGWLFVTGGLSRAVIASRVDL